MLLLLACGTPYAEVNSGTNNFGKAALRLDKCILKE
jgi:hypothetical protein